MNSNYVVLYSYILTPRYITVINKILDLKPLPE